MSRVPKSYYAILQLESSATADEIKAAYRQLVKSAHPDVNPSLDGDDSYLKELNEAYSVLGNVSSRLEYDIRSATTNLPAIAESTDIVDPLLHDVRLTEDDKAGYPPSTGRDANKRRIARWPIVLGGLGVIAIGCIGVVYVLPKVSPQKLTPGTIFSECYGCPSMAVVPAGTFIMGSQPDGTGQPTASSPAHLVTIRQSFAVARFLVTNAQYALFLTAMLEQGTYDQRWAETDQTAAGSHLLWRVRQILSENGFQSHPVTFVSWYGAKAYVNWLSTKTGHTYRLLSEAEWEYAARAGTQTKFYFGDDVLLACDYANTADYSFVQHHPNAGGIRCTDGYSDTSPVGTFKPNAFGLYDTIGNVWEWVEDCWRTGYDGAPIDGSPWIVGGNCSKRALRGQSFNFVNWGEGVAARSQWDAAGDLPSIGFRVARDIAP